MTAAPAQSGETARKAGHFHFDVPGVRLGLGSEAGETLKLVTE
jgi:hypothetical protein